MSQNSECARSGMLAWFWGVRGHLDEGRSQLTARLEVAGPTRTPLRADTPRVTGSLALEQADYAAARELYTESLAIERELGDRVGSLGALAGLGAAALQQGDNVTAETCFQEALAITQERGDNVGIAQSLNSLGNAAHSRGDLARAREFYERSLVACGDGGYRPDVVLHNLGVIAHEQSDLASARKLFEDSVAIKRALGDTPGLALSLAKLGEVIGESGDIVAAHRLLGESLILQRDVGGRPGIGFVLERFAMTAARHVQAERAVRLAVPRTVCGRASACRWITKPRPASIAAWSQRALR